MRKIRYAVAMSLDGYVAGPNGEYDWIGADPEVDFGTFWAQFDPLLIGRRTYELAVETRGKAAFTVAYEVERWSAASPSAAEAGTEKKLCIAAVSRRATQRQVQGRVFSAHD